ncbi:MAG: DUF5671 domain-containing protein [Candidatus Limnocylindria bacterium]|nr:DUF5671 domain-containing protein [Candidatus Limnocylindria bacterium]
MVTPDVASLSRAQPIVQRAYVYIVALVAIHMVVLGVANVLRVLAELALGAPSGGFTGLPFVFADFNRPRELYREQASLAIALLLVGTPVWWIHYQMAERAARATLERAAALRSLYVHLVVFVTALLVFGYGQRTVGLILQGTTFGHDELASRELFGLEANWEARAAGAGAMALAAALALAFHLRVSLADRRAAHIAGRAAETRHLALYALAVIGIFFAAFTTVTTLDGIWRRIVDAFVTLPGIPFQPPGVNVPSRDDALRFQLIGAVPAILAGVALWLGTWIPLQRGLATGPDVEVEQRSVVRKLWIYLVVFVSAVAVLVSATIGLSAVGRRLLGDVVVEQYSSLWHDLGSPVMTLVVFGALWIFHRRVVEGEASRETELARAATIRRLYTYLICAIGLAMTAIGAAGTIGVIGSQVMGFNTHPNGETATYISLVLVGAGAWAYHWRQARRRLDDDERASQPRRFYLYAAVLGGVLGLLVFGSAGLYRLLNAALAFNFTVDTWHDVWHFTVDAGVSGAAFLAHLRILRAERGASTFTDTAAAGATFAFLVRMSAADRDAAREQIANALPDASVVAVRTSPDGPGAVSMDSLTPIEQGPSIVAVIVAVLAALLLLPTLAGLLMSSRVSQPETKPPAAVGVMPAVRGPILWQDGVGRTLDSGDGEVIVGVPLALPVLVEVLLSAESGTTGVLEWTLREDDQGRIWAQVGAASETVSLNAEGAHAGGKVPAAGISAGRTMTLLALLDPHRSVLEVDGLTVAAIESAASAERGAIRMVVHGSGTYVIRGIRVYEVRPAR